MMRLAYLPPGPDVTLERAWGTDLSRLQRDVRSGDAVTVGPWPARGGGGHGVGYSPRSARSTLRSTATTSARRRYASGTAIDGGTPLAVRVKRQ